MLNSIIDKKEYGDPDLLKYEVHVQIGSHVEKIPGGAIEHFEVEMEMYGFSGSLSFSYDADLRKDTLISHFATEQIILLSIKFIPAIIYDEEVKPVCLKGIVREKSVAERRSDNISSQPILNRSYTVVFSDPATVLWSQHFPCELYVKQSMRQVIEKNITKEIDLDFKHAALNEVKPMIAVGLGKTMPYHSLNTGGCYEVSFYDFLLSYIETIHGVWFYDYEKQHYSILEKKPTPDKTEKFTPESVAMLRSYWPETPRHNLQLMNGIATGNDRVDFSIEHAHKSIRHDHLYREVLPKQFDKIKKVDEKQYKLHGAELHGAFSQWPLETYFPGCAFAVDELHWGKNALYAKKRYRCYKIIVSATQTEGSKKESEITDSGTFRLHYSFYAELESSPKRRRPIYEVPSGPFFVEGKIVSSIGDAKDQTYQIQESKESGLIEYEVLIPLFGKKIRVQFEADNQHPHFYFPLYKDTRVLLAMDMYKASIIKVLEWGRGVRLSPETQGNHLLLGKQDKDQTSINHVYQNGKPEFSIKRTKNRDTELITLKEGTLILQTKEE
ncbi:hypothetical protein [Marinibactrum halimedae]|uniref:hypothetical protein n=1 Tax=Marinibactrum halimedae TaxID=1444977 RepID=UPI001E4212B7|nr:hypothetical protein [Marinibactrum halimedae]MCD9458098.1 hypothetical protein [Marinibactrum halimedae]